MLHSCQRIIASTNVPAAIQAVMLMTALAPFFPRNKPDIFCRAIAKPNILIWLRDLFGKDIVVNQELVKVSGLSGDQFHGLTYERSGLDPGLVSSRLKTDLLILSSREIITVREQSRFGLQDVVNIPVSGSDGTLQGTLHIAMALDSSECRQEHTPCFEPFGTTGILLPSQTS